MSCFTIYRNVHRNWRNQLTITLSSPSESQVFNQFSSGERDDWKKKKIPPENFPHIRKYSLGNYLLPSAIFSTGIQFFFRNHCALVTQQAQLSDGFQSSLFLMTHLQYAFLHISLSLWSQSQNVNVKVGHIYMSPLMLITITAPHSLRDVINHPEYD